MTGPAPDGDLGPDDADIADPDTYVAGVPHATFLRMRRSDPVSWWGEDHAGGRGFWAVARHGDLLAVSRDVERFSSAEGIRLEEMDDEETEARRTMMELDPPAHTAYRRLVSKPFSRREVYAYETAIRAPGSIRRRHGAGRSGDVRLRRSCRQAVADAHARRVARRAGDGRAMAGRAGRCAARQHRSGVHDASGRSRRHRGVPADAVPQPGGRRAVPVRPAAGASRREHPTDDVISDLLRPKVDGEELSEHEFNNFFTLLVAAGNDTTRYTMTAGMKALIERPSSDGELRDAIVARRRRVRHGGGRGGAAVGHR